MAEPPIQQKARNALKDAFRHFDFDKSGFIQLHQLSMILTKLAQTFHVLKPTDQDVNQVYKELDLNGDGKISKGEFEVLIQQVMEIIKNQAPSTK